MITEILQKTGIPFRRTRFLKPPPGTYAIYEDDIETSGGDHLVAIYHHQITIELYESGLDDAAEEKIESILAKKGLQFEKQDRLWLPDEQRYQVVYEFDYYEKRRFYHA